MKVHLGLRGNKLRTGTVITPSPGLFCMLKCILEFEIHPSRPRRDTFPGARPKTRNHVGFMLTSVS